MSSRIADYMTPQPWAVQVDDSVGVARQMLAEREVHHLPVLDGGNVVGMITDRDIALVAGRSQATVGQVMARVHRVEAGAPLREVLDRMMEHRWDAVVVASDGKIEGIFTAMDA